MSARDKPSLLTGGSSHRSRVRYARLPLLLAGGASLLAGIWAGLGRAGVPVPVPRAELLALHGPFMIPGFLGTLIGIERAVGLGAAWHYASPVASALGTCLLLAGAPVTAAAAVYSVAAFFLTSTMVALWFQHRAWYTLLFVVAGALLLVGNLMWLATLSPAQASAWWLGFLIATIAAERMELSRVIVPPAWAQPLLVLAFLAFVVGILCGGFGARVGATIVGLALVGIASWLTRFDVAWRTLRHHGLPRFVAVSLLSGFGWLAVAGVVAVTLPVALAGPVYDSVLHSVLLGFVFSMIFAHAPMIFPAILHVRVPYHWSFYIHWAVLHGSLALRLTGDLSGHWFLRTWGILGNAAALALFLAVTIAQVLRTARNRSHSIIEARA